MKKLIPIIFVLGFIALLFQFFILIFTKHHEVDYSIITKDNSYMIHEEFKVTNGKHNYSFSVSDDKTKNVYLFDFIHNYHKQDSVIEDIKFFEYDDLACIFPIYKKGSSRDVICNYKGEQVSYSYLKQVDNDHIDDVVSTLKSEGYRSDSWKSNQTFENVNGYQIYRNNVPENIVFTMWFYRGFYRIARDGIEEKNFLNDDCYENNRSYLVNQFLFSIDTDDKETLGYTDFYIFDILNGGKVNLDFEEQLSKNMYFNGVYKGKLYYTDLDKKKQYSLEPGNESIKEVGNVNDGFKMVEKDSLVDVSAKDFLEDKVYFEGEVQNEELETLYGAKEIRKENDIYYFLTDEGFLYKVYATDIEHPILLFQFDSVSEWFVKEGNLMIVSHDMLYFYHDELGLLPIVKNNELNYNYKNICNFVIK